jgi:arylsulfatase A-like enzyme
LIERRVAPAGARDEPLAPWARRAACLAAVLVTAKLVLAVASMARAGGGALASGWAPPALLHQDVVAVAAFVLLDAGLVFALGARALADRFFWALYAGAASYTAINVPFALASGTPLTWGIGSALGGELSDSARAFLTPTNALGVGAPLVVAVLAPRLVRRRPPRALVGACLALGALLFVLGRAGVRRLETQGLHRNALVAMAESALAFLRGPGGAGARALVALPREGDALDLEPLAGVARGRHVVWVILESTGARYLRPYGAERDPTPHLSRLAERALVFQSVYAAYPESIKGLFAMLCASYPAPFTKAAAYAAARLSGTCIAQAFRDAGYRTGLFHSGRFAYLGMNDVVQGRGFERLEDAASIGGPFVRSFGTDDRSTVHKLLAFVDEVPRGERLLLVYMPIAGHHPYRAPGDGPRPFPETSDFDRYLNDLYAGDAAFGELVAGLEARGVYDQSLWIVVGDHGEAFLQHPGNVAHSLYVYEENVHVPLVIAIPGVTGEPRHVPQIGSVVDIPPTVLGLAGIEVPRSMQGRSLLAPDPGSARFFVDHALLQLGLRHGRFKLIDEPDTGRIRLFDLGVDPLERDDVAARHPARVARYRAHLRAWVDAERAKLR